MVLSDVQTLLTKAAEKVELEQRGRKVVGLKIRDEIGVGVGKRQVAFADRHERRQMVDRGCQQLELWKCPRGPGFSKCGRRLTPGGDGSGGSLAGIATVSRSSAVSGVE
ncbi:hypothetical protein PCPL58_1533 [Pseudomonas cerasi]|uniref:Uncharacterized protein n=1 Tax=Pseudomonas cerasi TaxID=1583341 RepID=A0A193SLP8_9PSED|nr:hypothetical protein PCPL58_1533 [Pseudomonas cerasi]SOS17532.1 hypothetical protein PL963_01567 [Pseudomonas cerasi]